MKPSERVVLVKSFGMPLLLVILAISTSASALLVPDAGPLTTSQSISSGGRLINISVTSNIWEYTDYMAVNPGTVITAGKYIYEYVVQNQQSSNVSLSMFQIPISSPSAINGIGTVNNNGGVGALSFIVDPATLPSATYMFLTPALAPGMGSVKLIYSSDLGWTTNTATVAGGSVIGSITQWTPVPEPVTALTLGLGGLALIRRKQS